MPYRKRFRKSGYYNRRGKRVRNIFWKRAAQKGYRLARKALSLINVENKYLDFGAGTTSSTTAALVLLNGMTLGDSSITREGQSIKVTSLFMNAYWSINSTTPQSCVMRAMIILDTQANAATPAITDILATSTSVISPMSISNGSRFKVLMDKRGDISDVGREIFRLKRYMKLSFHTKYNTLNNGTIADITTNALYLLHMSNIASGGNVPDFNYNIRVRFIDN